ncbi:protein phosphatase 1 regulatory subunit 3G-like [Triplophysa dalaica]|uniref:protein phosphatase 1 regulatory subunit 3G-like n=1 Tax=Triplophysa dalaica TaxID=1582913 RepID=UPI0024E02903|nr:protein phosphatase 1 regulatory subunit 3G-like [Triplophysa dalaica]
MNADGGKQLALGATSDLDETACPCESRHTSKDETLSPLSKSHDETDRRRDKSLPVYLDKSSTRTECHERVKRVQFADTLGLTLTSVRHFDTSDVTNETRNVSGVQNLLSPSTPAPNFARLEPAFNVPICSDEVDLKSMRLGVALESVTTGSDVKGLIRVMRSNATKEVGVLYTFNNWLTFSDLHAAPIMDKERLLQWERFHFVLRVPPSFDKDDSVHFAVFCRTDHGEYWDNNNGQNYTLRIQIT